MADTAPPSADRHSIVEIDGARWRIDPRRAIDLSVPLQFDGAQPNFFGAAPASSAPLSAGSFIGDVRHGGSCNCATYTLTPHCNGTHTECVGHVTAERLNVCNIVAAPLLPALLLTVEPQTTAATGERSDPPPQPGDRLITRQALCEAASRHDFGGSRALIVRTSPNPRDKLQRSYTADDPPPYFSVEAMRLIVARDIRHLVVDLPSIDRAADAGRLATHRLFWGLPPGATQAALATRADATITELAYIDDGVPDGRYLLNLQIAPFAGDAAPSRPILYPLVSA